MRVLGAPEGMKDSERLRLRMRKALRKSEKVLDELMEVLIRDELSSSPVTRKQLTDTVYRIMIAFRVANSSLDFQFSEPEKESLYT